MTLRIRTNEPALTSLKTMHWATKSQNRTMERLSTGLRINQAGDDPSGLIGANQIRSDVVGAEQAIVNTERGNLMIQTADSYLDKVMERLNDMRRLIVEAANDVAMPPEQIQANQLVIDASIQAIDRIAKTANFQGNKLFDGSYDYVVDGETAGNMNLLADIQLDSVRLDLLDGKDVRINVTKAAEQAEILFNAQPATYVPGGMEAFSPRNEPWNVGFTLGTGPTAFPVELLFDEAPGYAGRGIPAAYASTLSEPVTPDYFVQFIPSEVDALGYFMMEDPATGLFTEPLNVSKNGLGYGSAIQDYYQDPTFAPSDIDLFSYANDATGERTFTFVYNNNGAEVPFDGATMLDMLRDEIDEEVGYGNLHYTFNVEMVEGVDATYEIPGAYVSNPAGDANLVDGIIPTTIGVAGTNVYNGVLPAFDITGEPGTPFTFGISGANETTTIVNDKEYTNDVNFRTAPVISAVNFLPDNNVDSYAVNVINTGTPFEPDFTVEISYNNTYSTELDFDDLAELMEDEFNAFPYFTNASITPPAGSLSYTIISGNPAPVPIGVPSTPPGVPTNSEITATGTETGAWAKVGLGHAVKFDAAKFTDQNYATGDLVFRRVTGDALEVEVNFVQPNHGYYEGVTEVNGRYTITLFSSMVQANDNVSDLAEKFQDVIAASAYKESIYATWENLTERELVDFDGQNIIPVPPTPPAQLQLNRTLIDQSENDYLKVEHIGGDEYANNMTVALEFGDDDLVEYDRTIKRLTVTLSEDPDWDRAAGALSPSDPGGLTAQLRALGYVEGVDFSVASFEGLSGKFLNDPADPRYNDPVNFPLYPPHNTERLGITNRRNYETHGSTGTTGGFTLREKATFEMRGEYGMETITLGKGATRAEVASAFNTVTDSTGVTAKLVEIDNDGDEIMDEFYIALNSISYGSRQSIQIKTLEDLGYFDVNLDKHYAEGTDAIATINGIDAVADGNMLQIGTAWLDANILLKPGETQSHYFNVIPEGAAKFQLGQEVSLAQQTNIALGSLSSGSLGRSDVGYLYMLGTGQDAALANDVTLASQIIEEVIAQVSALSARLGAFQGTTIETNLYTLTDYSLNMRDLESQYRDADYAQESSNLARDQAIISANISVLSIANQSAQNVLQLMQ